MTKDRWQRVKVLFQAAAELAGDQRDVFLRTEAGNDSGLRAEVESLLSNDASRDSFFERLPTIRLKALADLLPGKLTSGTRIGPYEVVTLIGSGSMGEVYRGRDTKLHRDVALKVLPEIFARDGDRLARFTREAQLLATLNHPNIAGIYGLEEADGVIALVLELADGPTLAERLGAGCLPLDDALHVARQIASALEAAHKKGIIHRDLKPANIAVSGSGVVKVLDFGLATIADDADAAPFLQSPTLPEAGHTHTLLGTPTYMSPEQARGRSLDIRTDVWSFGCVLYEMLTGRPPVVADTVSDTLAAVVEHDIDQMAIPGGTPLPIRRLLRGCLEKDREHRLDSAARIRQELDQAIASTDADVMKSRISLSNRRNPAILVTIIVFVVTAGVWTLWRPLTTARTMSARFAIVTPSEPPLNLSGPLRDIAISPDGRRIAYRAGGSMTAGSGLMMRAIDQLDAKMVPSAGYVYAPFFSPDGRWIGFFSRSQLKKVSTLGGDALDVCELSGAPLGASWGDDDTITFAVSGPPAGLWRVPADGGTPTLLLSAGSTGTGDTYAFPSALPRGEGVLFTIQKAGQPDASSVAAVALRNHMPKVLIRGATDAQYVDTGHIVFAAGGTLRAARFDPVRLELLSEPVRLAEDVFVKLTGAVNFAPSRAGTLLYVTAAAGRPSLRSLVWVDRKGHEVPLDVPLRSYGPGRISPDGTRIAVGIVENGNADVWIVNLADGQLKRLTFASGTNGMPLWTPDGRRIIFSMRDQRGVLNLYVQSADGTEAPKPITSSPIPQWPTSVMPDGRRVFGFELGPKKPNAAIVVRIPPADRTVSFDENLFRGSFPEISPDGRFLAYASDESGQLEVYVRAFPNVRNGPWRISTAGGAHPAWARNGRELFFLDASNALTAVAVNTSGPTLVSGTPAKLFDTRYLEPNPARHYDVSLDGQRFLMIKDSPADPSATPASMVFVQSWFDELKTRAR